MEAAGVEDSNAAWVEGTTDRVRLQFLGSGDAFGSKAARPHSRDSLTHIIRQFDALGARSRGWCPGMRRNLFTLLDGAKKRPLLVGIRDRR